MAGPILNTNASTIPLTWRFSEGRDFEATDKTLVEEIARNAWHCWDWMLYLHVGMFNVHALFDRPRLICYHNSNTPSWRTEGDGVLRIGPGWEGFVADVYWAGARAVHEHLSRHVATGADEVVLMALQAMMRSHGRA